MFARRLMTLSALVVITCLSIILAPLLVPVALLLSLFPGLGSLPRAVGFAYGFLFFEWAGVLRLFWVWLRYRTSPLYFEKTYDVQAWWAQQLLALGTRLYSLSFTVTGEQAVQGPSAILIARHASMGDNVLPLLFFGVIRNEPLRYILKKELTILPTLDIGGHRIPNLFVDRSGEDTESAIQGVRDLVSTAGPDESILVYPEGTRFTRAKHIRLGRRPGLAGQIQRWPDLLPPRLGGITAMLEANPGKDAVFLCHTGFEGSASLSDLINGGWVNQNVHIHFWRVPYAEIPTDLRAFVFQQWDRMQAQVVSQRASPLPD